MAGKRRSVSYYNSIKVCRREWKASTPDFCMYCLKPFPDLKLQVHEIERRSHAHNKWWPESGCNGLKLCERCHAGEFSTMPHAKQLAVKLIQDPECFDLGEWLSIKPRPPEYVTLREVLEYVKGLV